MLQFLDLRLGLPGLGVGPLEACLEARDLPLQNLFRAKCLYH